MVFANGCGGVSGAKVACDKIASAATGIRPRLLVTPKRRSLDVRAKMEGKRHLDKTLAGDRIFDGKRLRCTVFGSGEPLFATFDNFVREKSAFAACRASRKVLAAGFRQVVIQTCCNDWYLNPELDDLRALLRLQTDRGAASKALGFSMGAFGALLCAEALHISEMYLVSPRFPRPTGWVGKAKVNCADQYLAADWQSRLVEATAISHNMVIFYDHRSFDDRMAAHWLERTNLDVKTVGIAFGGHPCTGYINDANKFGELQDILLRPEVSIKDIVTLKRAARLKSPAYRARLQVYLESRASRDL